MHDHHHVCDLAQSRTRVKYLTCSHTSTRMLQHASTEAVLTRLHPPPRVVVGDHQASPSQSGPASEPPGAPSVLNLARDCTSTQRPRRASGAHNAVSWQHRCPPKAPYAPDAHHPHCRKRHGPCWPHLRVCGSRWARSGDPTAARRPPWPASPARCGGAATMLRPVPQRQTRQCELWATRVRGQGRMSVAEQSN